MSVTEAMRVQIVDRPVILIVSSIYRWYVADFGGGNAGVLKHLRQYARGELAEKLARNNFIGDDEYDWSINDLNPQ